FVQGRTYARTSRTCRGLQAMVDVIVDQDCLGIGDCLLDGVQLLRQLEARPSRLHHADNRVQMPFGALQPPDDVGMRLMQLGHNPILLERIIVSSSAQGSGLRSGVKGAKYSVDVAIIPRIRGPRSSAKNGADSIRHAGTSDRRPASAVLRVAATLRSGRSAL